MMFFSLSKYTTVKFFTLDLLPPMRPAILLPLITCCGCCAPIELELPVPSGAAIILTAGLLFVLAAVARGLVPGLKGNAG